MKQLKFYVCPACGNVLTAAVAAEVSCCGGQLQPLTPHEAEQAEKLCVQEIENEYFVSTDHEMTREHYISFAALLTEDSIMLRTLYPEWELQVRFPRIRHATLVWYCVQHGLFYQKI